MEMDDSFRFFLLGIIIAITSAADLSDSGFNFGSSTSTSSPRPTTISPSNSTTINSRILAWNARSQNGTGAISSKSAISNVKNRNLFDDLLPALGGSSSLESNSLTIQSNNVKLTKNNGRFNSDSGFPPGFQPGPPIPVGIDVSSSPGLSSPLASRIPNLPANCRCEAFADCRDVSAFARSDRTRIDYCGNGQVLCCNGRTPVVVPNPGNPAPIINPNPFNPTIPLPGNGIGTAIPNNIVNGNLIPNGGTNQGCGIKGGNPLARTFDATNPRNEAEFGEYPWMAAILKADLNYVCGGALIDARIVLTAAHCVAKVKNQDLVVRLGEYDVSETTEPPFQDIHVRKVIIHADYHSGTLRNDIALLILDRPVLMNGYIRPVCLPPPNMDAIVNPNAPLNCQVSGWGKNNPNGQFSNVLKESDVPLVESNQCQAILRTAPEIGPVFNLHSSFLCAGAPGKDACAGDGGSPLVCKIDGAYRLAGLVSWGINCGQYPGVYTRISSFIPWILAVSQENA